MRWKSLKMRLLGSVGEVSGQNQWVWQWVGWWVGSVGEKAKYVRLSNFQAVDKQM